MAKITLTKEEKLQYLHSAFCNTLSMGVFNGYGIMLNYEKADYTAANDKLSKKSSPCYEDVLIQMLKDGKTLKFVDEDGGGDWTKEITMETVIANYSLVPTDTIIDFMQGNDDADTGDILLQHLIWGELVFG